MYDYLAMSWGTATDDEVDYRSFLAMSWGTATDDEVDHRSFNGAPKTPGQERLSITIKASRTLTDMALPIIASKDLIGTSGGRWIRCGLMC